MRLEMPTEDDGVDRKLSTGAGDDGAGVKI